MADEVVIAGPFRWRRSKADLNVRKHRGIRFPDAIGIFEDDWHWDAPDRDHAEERWNAVGLDPIGRLLVVTYTWDEDESGAAFRWILSARRAEADDAETYSRRRGTW